MTDDAKFEQLLEESDNLCDLIDATKSFADLRRVLKKIDDNFDQMIKVIENDFDEDFSELTPHDHM